MPKTAGIVLVGNEILSGKIADANAAYLCRELRALGVDVRRISVIPDEIELIAHEVAHVSRAPDGPDAQRLHPAGGARDLSPEVRGDPRAVPRPAHSLDQRLRRDRRGNARRLPERAPRGLPAAAPGLVPGVRQSPVQGEGDAGVAGSWLPRERAGGVPAAPAGRRAREGHLARSVRSVPLGVALVAIGLYFVGLGAAPFLDPP